MDPFSLLTGAAIGGGVAAATRRFLTYRAPRERALADILPWTLLIGDGVILLKDATFIGGFTIRGADLTSAPHEAVNKAADTIRELIGQMPSGFSLEVNIHRIARKQYQCQEEDHFPTPALKEVDQERAHHFTRPGSYYESVHTLIISFTPDREDVRKFEGIFVKGGSSTNYGTMLDGFQHSMDEIKDFLAPFFDVRRMDSTRLVTECHQCLSGDPSTVVPDGGYLCYALASGDYMHGYIPRFREQHLHCVAISSYGPSVTVASGDFFNTLRDDVRWHMRYLPLPRAQAESRIRMIQKDWFSKRKGLTQFMPGGDNEAVLEDPHAVAMQKETAEALGELTSGRVRYGYLSNVIVIRDKDISRGRARADAIVQRAREAGYVAMIESINTTSAFLGSLPGAGAINLRRLLVSSRVCSHLFPTTMPWAGDRFNPSSLFPKQTPPLLLAGGKGATPFRLHLHHGDVGHALIVGATGAGKSVLVGTMMMSWLRYKASRVICFDVGRSHERLTKAAGGEHVEFGAADGERIQPLRHLDTETDLLWAESWITGLCSLAGVKITPKDRADIGHAIRLTAKRSLEHRTLSILHATLPPDIQPVVESYTKKGTFGKLFDGAQDDLSTNSRMRTIELSEVINLGDAVVVPLLMVLFRQVERSLDGSPLLIVIEEAWSALMRGEFSMRLQQWLLTLRKKNAAVTIVAHSPTQIQQLRNGSLITDSCPTRILLPNPEATNEEHAKAYRYLDLTTSEINTIAAATPKQEYYYRSPRGSRLFDLCLGTKAKQVLIPPKASDDPLPDNGSGSIQQSYSHLKPNPSSR